MPTLAPKKQAGRFAGVVTRVQDFRRALAPSVRNFFRHGGFTSSAALAFYFLLSLLPFLIFLASALAFLPVHHLAERMTSLVSHFVPDQTLPMVRSMLISTMQSDEKLLSLGFVFAIVAASNAFAVMMEMLDGIYLGEQARSFWKVRLDAIYVTIVVGGLTVIALSAVLLGPRFAEELRRAFRISDTFVRIWPETRWLLVVGCVLASIEVLYYLGPSRRHPLRQQLSGSVFAVAVWIASSDLLGIYFREFAYLNAMYGTLTSFIVLMIWLQLIAAAILMGAELNVELDKLRKEAAAPA